MSRIFISYARADVDFARKLARSLSEMGADIWIDVNDIPAGMKWSTAIQQGLNVCQVMLVIISPDSMASNNVEDEWQYYLDKKKPIIPVWYLPAEKHFQISRLQHIDFYAISYHIAFDRLTHELNRQGISIQFPTTDTVGAQGFSPSAPATSNATASPRIEIPSPEPEPGTRMTDDKGIEMVYVPAGKFLMGSNKNPREKPIHEVQITQPFWLDLTPVTNAAYAHFVNAGGYKKPDYWTQASWDWLQTKKITAPSDYDNFTDPRQPRIGVSWYEVCAYARWRGGRLPTEAEWEWAARGPENRSYPWGDTFDASRLIYRDNSLGKSAIVGSGIRVTGASWVGALDMSGNVWEWQSSLYIPYPYQSDDGREDQNKDGTHVLRGGSFFDGQDLARSAYRNSSHPYSRNYGYFFGFRVVRPPSL